MSECVFCKNLPKILENDLAYGIYDIRPITEGHLLLIPKRHFEQIFEATGDEVKAIHELVGKAKALLDRERKPDGYNVVANCGADAGQIVMHAHLHLIPRYKGKEFNIRSLVH
jgi:diadenosine tetraphosphate (Ap4A) HIT family hydrolase